MLINRSIQLIHIQFCKQYKQQMIQYIYYIGQNIEHMKLLLRLVKLMLYILLNKLNNLFQNYKFHNQLDMQHNQNSKGNFHHNNQYMYYYQLVSILHKQNCTFYIFHHSEYIQMDITHRLLLYNLQLDYMRQLYYHKSIHQYN